MLTPAYNEQQHRANRSGAHPKILEFTDKLVKRCRDLGIPVFPHCIVRTRADQQSAFVLGHSRDSPNDGLWPHRAFAVDIIHSKLGWMEGIPHSREMWLVIGHLGKEVASSMSINIEWGGDWKFYDPSHFELSGWKDIALHGDKLWAPKDMVETVERIASQSRA